MMEQEREGVAQISITEYDALKEIEREYDDDHTFKIIYTPRSLRGVVNGEWQHGECIVSYVGKEEVLRNITDALESANSAVEASKRNIGAAIEHARKEEHLKIRNLSFIERLRFIISGEVK